MNHFGIGRLPRRRQKYITSLVVLSTAKSQFGELSFLRRTKIAPYMYFCLRRASLCIGRRLVRAIRCVSICKMRGGEKDSWSLAGPFGQSTWRSIVEPGASHGWPLDEVFYESSGASLRRPVLSEVFSSLVPLPAERSESVPRRPTTFPTPRGISLDKETQWQENYICVQRP